MGKEEKVAAETAGIRTGLLEMTSKAVTKNKKEEIDEVKDNKKIKTNKMDEDSVVKVGGKIKQVNEKKEQRGKMESKKEEKEKAHGVKDEEMVKESKKEETESKKHGNGKSDGKKINEKAEKLIKKDNPIQKTPAMNRPVRVRKSVKRLVASIDNDVKEVFIAKGQGTALKDIPNVAFKLSRRKNNDTFKILHMTIFGRRGKAHHVKYNISHFSGFVWHEHEEKQKKKVRGKLDRFNKDKLADFCDVLDIPIVKTTKKEDIVTRLIEFLMAPEATTSVLLAEKEKSSMGNKRKRLVKSSAVSESATSKRSGKKQRKDDDTPKSLDKKSTPDKDDNSKQDEEEKVVEEEIEQEENVYMVPEKYEDEMPELSESEEKNESGKDVEKQKMSSIKSGKKEYSNKSKMVSDKSIPAPKEKPKKSSSKHKVDNDREASSTVVSLAATKEKLPASTKAATEEKKGKSEAKRKDKAIEKKSMPDDYELKDEICETLKEVDLSKVTTTDILMKVACKFSTDLTPRKYSIKLMIRHELSKMQKKWNREEISQL